MATSIRAAKYMMSRVIDAFCHILTPKYEEMRWARAGSKEWAMGSPAHLQYVRTGRKAPNYEGLTSLDARFRMMDQFPGYRQIISLAGPPPEHVAPQATVELATVANDEMAALVAAYPDRFAGAAACLPMNEPERACREIERATGPLGLRAVQIYTNVNGRPLDAPEFRVVFRTLAERGVPILLHPARGRTQADYAVERESKYLVWQTIGWPYESSAAAMRLVFSGIMQEYPELRILVHHTVAMIPFLHGRLQSMFDMFADDLRLETEGRLTRPALEYFKRFYGDLGAFSAGALNVARDFLGADHLLFGSDAPFDATGGAWSIRASIDSVKNSACTEAEKQAIFTTNVERFFNLPAA